MTVHLDLADIQGGLLTAYGKQGFPKGRLLVLNIRRAEAGRSLVQALLPQVTTALRWPSRRGRAPVGSLEVTRPPVTLNLAFTFTGLLALRLPVRTLRGLPEEFIDGMAARARALGDDPVGLGAPPWDPAWRTEGAAHEPHLIVLLNAQIDHLGEAVPGLERVTQGVRDACAATGGGVTLIRGHGRDGSAGAESDQQNLSALFERDPSGALRPSPREHFGLMDAISDPVFDGQLPHRAERTRAEGAGKVDRRGRWTPLATGEFLLGYPDEAQEIAGAAMPLAFSRNGAFVALRKLHQDIAAFDQALAKAARPLGLALGLSEDAARTTLMAKIAGRWPDGVSLVAAPTFTAWMRGDGRPTGSPEQKLRALNAFGYGGDPKGVSCPLGAHVRRMNPRDALDPLGPAKNGLGGSALNNRRRILRRGLPYGARNHPDGEHGIVFMAVCSSLFRQFEFVQQQWLNYGLDFNAGNDTCPLAGDHRAGAKFVIPAPEGSLRAPFILDRLPQFVSVRGGAYLFMPSLTALRMMGDGMVDPT